MFHKISSVIIEDNDSLLVFFQNGIAKEYDMKPVIRERECFKDLKNDPTLFSCARVDTGGYAVIWNDEIDIDGEELWQNGTEI